MRGAVFSFAILWAMGPGGALACVYPMALRNVNTAFVGAFNAGGAVDVHLRMRLQRSLEGTSIVALEDAVRGEISRSELRAVRGVLTAARALARGDGRALPADLRAQTTQLAEAVQSGCSGAGEGTAGAGDAATAEQGTERREGGAGTALTFREGVQRLSMTFTLYMVFLAFLLGLRRIVKTRMKAADADERVAEPPPVQDVLPP